MDFLQSPHSPFCAVAIKKRAIKTLGSGDDFLKTIFNDHHFVFVLTVALKNKKRKEKEIDERRGRWSHFGPCEKKSANHVLLFSIFLVLRRLQMESVSQWTRSIKDAVSNVVVVVVVRFLFLFFSFFLGGGRGDQRHRL